LDWGEPGKGQEMGGRLNNSHKKNQKTLGQHKRITTRKKKAEEKVGRQRPEDTWVLRPGLMPDAGKAPRNGGLGPASISGADGDRGKKHKERKPRSPGGGDQEPKKNGKETKAIPRKKWEIRTPACVETTKTAGEITYCFLVQKRGVQKHQNIP